MNVTTVLSSFVGSDNAGINTRDFPFTFKIAGPKNKGAVRTALGAAINTQSNTDVINAFIQTQSQDIYAKVGYEWRQPVLRRLNIYYGFDALASFENEVADLITGFDESKIKERRYSFGGGPVYGVQFIINPKILLSFEGSFYVISSYETETESFRSNPSFNTQNESWLLNADATPPQWMYLIFRF